MIEGPKYILGEKSKIGGSIQDSKNPGPGSYSPLNLSFSKISFT
jgi:hypothetical protein